MQFDIARSLDELAAPIQHFDSRVFPDNSDWYRLFERYIAVDGAYRCIAYARSDDDVDEALLPTQLVRNSSAFTTLQSLDNYYSVDYRPICSTTAAKSLIKPMLEELLKREKPHLLLLRALDPDSQEKCIIMHSLQDLGWRPYSSPQQANWTHQLNGSFDHYLASRSSRLRNTLKRKTAKLVALPNFTFTVFTDVQDLEKAVRAYNDVYFNSWKVPEPHPEFVPQLIRATAKLGHLRLGIIWLGDMPIAAHFWIVKQNIAFIYKLAHDKAFDSFSPGTVLMGQMIEYTIKHDKIEKLDFLSGDDPYKKDWMSDRHQKIQIHAYNPRSPLAQWVRFRDNYLKTVVKQFAYQSRARTKLMDWSEKLPLLFM